MPKIYMDYAATTPLDGKVLEAMLPYLTNVHGNPSSLHFTGREAREALDESREKVARALGADPEEIIFTSGGTEANNMAIQGASRAFKKALSPGERGHIITSSIEHHAVLDTVNYLGNTGFDVTFLPVDEYGLIDPEELAEHITDKTFLVTIMTANNEIGTIQPFEEIGRVCRENGVYFHTDAVQAIGHIPFNLKEQPVDMLSLSAHKFYGPKGVGVLYLRKHTKIEQAFWWRTRKVAPRHEEFAGLSAWARQSNWLPQIWRKSIRLTVLRSSYQRAAGNRRRKINGHLEKAAGNVNVSYLYRR